MASLKLSPLILFIILLVVLVLSFFVCSHCKWMYKNNFEEGMVGYLSDQSIGSTVNIQQYSKTIKPYKLHDNIYYDVTNANLIEICGMSSGNVSGNIVSDSSTITSINTMNSNGSMKFYSNISVNTNPISNQLTPPSTSNKYVYESMCTNTDTYDVIYIPLSSSYVNNQSAFIHIINKTSTKNIQSFFIDKTATLRFNTSFKPNENPSPTIPGTYTKDSNDSSLITDNTFSGVSSKVYQLCRGIEYDPQSALLYINDNGTARIYNSSGTTVSSAANISLVSSENFRSMTKIIGQNNLMVVFMSYSTYNLVLVLSNSGSSNPTFTIVNYVIYNGNQNITPVTTDPRDLPRSGSGSGSNRHHKYEPDNDKYKLGDWDSDDYPNGFDLKRDSNYMLKTQIIPPVCPACPACPAFSGVCSSCGGHGGSGTQGVSKDSSGNNTSNNNSNNSGNNSSSSTSYMLAKTMDDMNNGTIDVTNNLINKTTGLASSAGSGAVDLSKDVLHTGTDLVGGLAMGTGALALTAGSGATNLVRDAAGGATSLVRDAAGGATGLIKDTAGGATGLIKDAAGGIYNVAKGVGGGVSNVLQSSNNQSQYGYNNSYNPRMSTYQGGVSMSGPNGPGTGPYGSINGIDNYSYYGQLPQKNATNFVPVTADFSRFGR